MAAAFGLFAVPAQSETPGQNGQNPTTASVPAKAKKICRNDPSSTGSIMARRTCRTQAEWDALSKANRGTTSDMRDSQDTHQMMQDTIGR
jgi:hypothetical protein